MELDADILAQLEEVGGRKLLEELFELYLTHAPERLERIRAALAGGDLPDVAKALHSLRSSSATLGATTLAAALGELEQTALAGDIGEVAQGWPGIERQAEGVLATLRSQKGGEGSGAP